MNHFTQKIVYSTNINQPIPINQFFLAIIFNELTPIKPLFSYYCLKTRIQSAIYQPILLYHEKAISYATFKWHCTYPKHLNLNLEVMWNQIRIFQETNENRATRYSNQNFTGIFQEIYNKWELRCKVLNAAVYKNHERLFFEDSCCWLNFQRWMVETVWIHDKPIIRRTAVI